MRRSLAKIPIGVVIPKHSAFSTSSSGRGRGRGFPNELSVGSCKPNPKKDESSSTGQPEPQPQPPIGYGRGQPQPPIGYGRGQPLPSFTSFVNPHPPASAGRGRGSTPSKPISHDFTPSPPPPPPVQPSIASHKPQEPDLPSSIFSALPGAGRGKPVKPVEAIPDKPKRQENRHIRPTRPVKETSASSTTPVLRPPKLSREEATRKAVGILSKGHEQRGSDVGGGRGGSRVRGGRMSVRGRPGGRRGGVQGRVEDRDNDYATGLYLGDNADGEKLAKRLGPGTMNKLVEAFEEMSGTVLPSPADDLYLEAFDTNLKIECEPEYMMGEFTQNPDIDEKPPIPLRDALEKMKPFLVAYEGIQSQEEWEEVVQETMERVPLIKEIVDYYSGPDRVTAKQQQEELERVAKTIPEGAPASVKTFTDRAVLSLQSNPGWGFDKKCQFMDKLVWEVSQQYK